MRRCWSPTSTRSGSPPSAPASRTCGTAAPTSTTRREDQREPADRRRRRDKVRRPRGRPGDRLRPRLPVRLRRLAGPPRRPRQRPGRAPRRRGGGGRRRHRRADRRLRTDEARPAAGGLRIRPARRPAALATVRGRRRHRRRARRHAVPGILDGVLALRQPGRRRLPAVPEPADPGGRQHRCRPGRRDLLRPHPRRSAGDVPRGRRGLDRGARGRGAVFRAAGRTPGARRAAAEGDLERPGAALGRADVLRFRRLVLGVPGPAVPPPRGVRPGRVRHRRLGQRLPELDAGDPARRADRVRRQPAPDRRRRRAGAAGAVAARPGAPRALAARHHAGGPARRRPAPGRDPHRPPRRRRASPSPTAGAAPRPSTRWWRPVRAGS